METENDPSFQAPSTASDLTRKLSLRKRSAIFCQPISDDVADTEESESSGIRR